MKTILLCLLSYLVSLAFSFQTNRFNNHASCKSTTNNNNNIVSMSIKNNIIVPDNIKKERLDVFLSEAVNDNSRSFYGNLCEKGKIQVNSIVRDKAYKVSKGDRIEFEVEEKAKIDNVEAENIPLDILYEDKHIISINKPNGMVVHPAPGSPNGTFVNALLWHLGDEAKNLLVSNPFESNLTFTSISSSSNGIDPSGHNSEDFDDIDFDDDLYNNPLEMMPSVVITSPVDLPETPEAAQASPLSLRPGVVHRLDKGTTGVLLAGKHTEAVAKLSMLFAARKVQKIYLAICIGHPGESTIVEPIGRSLKNRQMMTVYGRLYLSYILIHLYIVNICIALYIL